MSSDLEIFAVTILLGGGALFLLAFSPIGRAIAHRIRGRVAAPSDVSGQEARAYELQELRREVAELAERVNFLKRLQAKPQEAGRLVPPP